MAVGKNKRLAKGGKGKGGKKKIVDPFSRKDWYDVRAPSMFGNRDVGKTIVNRTQGTKIASEGLKGRVFEVTQADIHNDEMGYRKFRLMSEDVSGKQVLTQFHGMNLTTDKIRSMVKKWQSLIEAHVDVKTTDGYLLRVFVIAFTKKRANTMRKTAYAQHAQIKEIRKRITKLITDSISKADLKDTVKGLLMDTIAKEIEKACSGVYPLHDVYVRKVKVMKKPKFELSKLLEIHGEGGKGSNVATLNAEGQVVERPDGYEPPVLQNV